MNELQIDVGDTPRFVDVTVLGKSYLDLSIQAQGHQLLQHIQVGKDCVQLFLEPSTNVVMHCLEGAKHEASPEEWLTAMREKRLTDENKILKDKIEWLESQIDISKVMAEAAEEISEVSRNPESTLFDNA